MPSERIIIKGDKGSIFFEKDAADDGTYEVSKELKFVSMSRSLHNTTINLDIRPKSFQNLTKFTGLIKKRFKNSKVILSYNDELSL